MRIDNAAYYRGNAVTGSARLRDAILGCYAPQSITVPVVKNKRGRPRKGTRPHVVNFAIIDVQARVAAHYRMPLLALLTSSRIKPRHIAMFLARETGASLPEIGRHFGRDHTTVLHAIRAVAAQSAYWTDVINIRTKLRNPVDYGDKCQTMSNSRSQCGKEQAVNAQEEMAA